MPKTDGFVIDVDDDTWKKSNQTQPGGSGKTISTDADAWIRVEKDKTAGASAGGAGGHTVDFTQDILGQVPATNQGPPFIPWAGFHPNALKTMLIVWSQPVNIMDRSKINAPGMESVSVVGRLMTIQLSEGVTIDGENPKTVTFRPGAVIAYPDTAQEEGEDPPPTQRNGEFNKELSLSDVKCTHPFELKECNWPCGKRAKVWAVCLELFGATSPTGLFPLDKLREVDVDNFGQTAFPNGYPAVITQPGGPFNCGTAVAVQLMGTAGGREDITLFVTYQPAIEGESIPAVEGQPVLIRPCEDRCNDTDDLGAYPYAADCFIPEAIQKPYVRRLPVAFFEPIVCTNFEITLPTTIITQTLPELITDFQQTQVSLVVDLVTDSLEVLVTPADLTGKEFAVNVAGKTSSGGLVTSVTNAVALAALAVPPETEIIVPRDLTVSSATVSALLPDPGGAVSIPTSVTPSGLNVYVLDGPGPLTVATPRITSQSLVVCDEAGNSTTLSVAILVPGEFDTHTAVGANIVEQSMVTSVNVASQNFSSSTFDAVTDVSFTDVTLDRIDVVGSIATSTIGTYLTSFENVTLSKETIKDVASFTILPDIQLAYNLQGAPAVEIQIPQGELIQQALLIDAGGDITFITNDPAGGCDSTYKFLEYADPVIKHEKIYTQPTECPGTVSSSGPSGIYDEELGCTVALVFKPEYVLESGPAMASAEQCPCYDGSQELTCEDVTQDGDYEQNGGPLVPCFVTIRRLNRRWCRACAEYSGGAPTP